MSVVEQQSRRRPIDLVGLLERIVERRPGRTAAQLVRRIERRWITGLTESFVVELLDRSERFIKPAEARPRWYVARIRRRRRVEAPVAAPPANLVEIEPSFSLDNTVRPSLRLYAWQDEALRAWDAAGRRGIIQAVTGTGKTVVAIAAA